VKPEVVIELGTGYGCSAIFMALGDPEVTIYTVDDYRGDTSTHLWISKANVEECGVEDQVILIDGDSRKKIETGILAEMVFMDASHNPKDMTDELQALRGNLKQSHILVIDDVYSVDLDRFASDLLKSEVYQELHVFPFHNGVAVLSTDPGMNRKKITDAVNGVYDA
jgi:predicted O-methyltransferase YrrM